MAGASILLTSSVFDAAKCMREMHATALAVRAHDQTLCGIVSEQDLLRRCLLAGRDKRTTPVADIMTTSVEFVTVKDARDNILGLQARLAELGIKHMPVVTSAEERKVVGCLDILTVSERARNRAAEAAGFGVVGRIMSSIGTLFGVQAAKSATATGLMAPMPLPRSDDHAEADDPSSSSSSSSTSSSSAASSAASMLMMSHNESILAVSKRMADRGVTAIIMHAPEDLTIITGIVTARDIVTKILASPEPHPDYTSDPLAEPAFLRAMTFDPIMVDEASATVQGVLGEMQRRKFRYVSLERNLRIDGPCQC